MTLLQRWCAVAAAVGGLSLLWTLQQRMTPASPQRVSAEDLSTSGIVLPTHPSLARSADGRHYPLVPRQPGQVARLLASLEAAIRDPAVPSGSLPRLAHQQQVIYRVLSKDGAQHDAVRRALDRRWVWVFDQHIAARRAFLAMHRGSGSPTVPGWRIQLPAPEAELLRAYRSAAQASGIPWSVLAAVNLVETGMGRIDGISVANAQGPMQFLPTTWAEPGIGRDGDIRDPWDSIHAAARYLVRRGGLQSIRTGLWGYNNSDHYGEAVLRYAALMDRAPLAYRGLYHWQIHYASAEGDLWLHEGYSRPTPINARQHVREFPHSQPPSTLP